MDRRVVFVSHSRKDIARVNRLVEELKKADFEVTRSNHRDDLDTVYLERACVFVVCLSVDYCTDDACHSEFLMLHWQEKPLIPVVLDMVSWPPGDNLFIHRDFFWSLTYLMVDVSGDQSSGGRLVNGLNNALGITSDETDESWRVGSPRKTAPSPAALSVSQQKAKDEEILMQLAVQSAEYQKLASAPPSVSGRDRSRSGVNSIDQSMTGSRYLSRRSSLLTVTTMEEVGERKDENIAPETCAEESRVKMTTDIAENPTEVGLPASVTQNIEDSKENKTEQGNLERTQRLTEAYDKTTESDDHVFSDSPPKLRRRMEKKSKSCIIL